MQFPKFYTHTILEVGAKTPVSRDEATVDIFTLFDSLPVSFKLRVLTSDLNGPISRLC
jgi:hypothetical protein